MAVPAARSLTLPASAGGSGAIGIDVHGLTRRFGEFAAVEDASFSVAEGEVFGFLGPNGAGKSTTIGMLCTLLRPSSGSATVAGFDLVRQRMQVRRSIGLVFQDPTLDQYLTAAQNLRFHAYAYRLGRQERDRRMRDLLTMVELWDRRDQAVRDFSGGMKRRLEIARGLLHHPRVLFLDEPTLGLDPQTRTRIWEYLLELRKREPLTIFLTTHYMDEAEHCGRIAVIDQGRIVALDTPDALKDALGGDVVWVRTGDPAGTAAHISRRYGLDAAVHDQEVVFNVPRGDEFLPEFVRSFEGQMSSIGVRRPTLDDVFLSLTGRAIREQHADLATSIRAMAARRR
jgi:ABC-2 type transport system ATP-binding protein